MGEPAELIEQAVSGGLEARRKLFEFVYADLKRMARGKLAAERVDHSLSATALVHEVYLKLGGKSFGDDSNHLIRAAAMTMRSILIDAARQKGAQKRGGKAARSPLDLDSLSRDPASPDLEDIDEAMQTLRSVNPQAADVIQMRFYCGMKWGQIAECLAVSDEKVTSLWTYGSAKLRLILASGGD